MLRRWRRREVDAHRHTWSIARNRCGKLAAKSNEGELCDDHPDAQARRRLRVLGGRARGRVWPDEFGRGRPVGGRRLVEPGHTQEDVHTAFADLADNETFVPATTLTRTFINEEHLNYLTENMPPSEEEEDAFVHAPFVQGLFSR